LSRKLFGWFAPNRGEKVLAMVEKHLELTKGTVTDMYHMVDAAAQCDDQKCSTYYISLSKLEMEADELRRQMIEALTKSEMFPEERDDLMELVRDVDWIADWSKEAGRILNIIHLDVAPQEMRNAALNMARADVDCVVVLEECIKMISIDPKEAINLANKVELLEEDIDELYSQARVHLANLDFRGWTVGSLILLNMFLDSLETVADWCENTADIVRAVSVRIR
jgi:predicted phosphate transport protein (TIGR00153 family)